MLKNVESIDKKLRKRNKKLSNKISIIKTRLDSMKEHKNGTKELLYQQYQWVINEDLEKPSSKLSSKRERNGDNNLLMLMNLKIKWN